MKMIRFGVVTATAAALSSPLALAVDAEAVSLYGQAHVSLDFLDDSDETNVAVSSNSSRLGVKGSVKLDDGYTAFYLAEWGVGYSGEKDWNNRNRYLGIKGDFGQVLLGKYDTPLKKLGRSVDLFWSSQLGENRVLTASNGFDARYNNGIVYSKGLVDNKLTLTGAYYTDVENGNDPSNTALVDDNTGEMISGSVVYKDDMFMVGFGYESLNGEAFDPDAEDAAAMRLVGSVNLGEHRIVGFLENATDVGGADGLDQTIIGAGWSMKMNKMVYKAQAYIADEFDDVDDSGGTLIAVGADYIHNEHVTCYGTLGAISNDDAASYAIVGVGHDDKINAIAGESNAGLSAGIRIMY